MAKKKTTKRKPVTFTVCNVDELVAAARDAQRGDVIELMPGTYILNKPPLGIPAGVEIKGEKPTTNVDVQVNFDARVYLDAFRVFRDEWAKLPPLVRAGMASGVVERMGVIAAEHDKRIELFQRLRLERRAEVLRRFTRATGAIQTLFAALCLQADNEAAERGIDLHVQPDPDTQFALGT